LLDKPILSLPKASPRTGTSAAGELVEEQD